MNTRSTMPDESVLAIDCAGERCWGVLSRPAAGGPAARVAVLIIVGGPQYRAGSHRQFVLLARALAQAGYPALRFDVRGMGDGEGALRDFQQIGPDVRAALDALAAQCPGTERIVVWGLCDGASAALMFAAGDPRVGGIVAANPWVRSEASLAAAQVKHYYAARLMQREFWVKLASGGLNVGESLRSLLQALRRSRALGRPAAGGGDDASAPFQQRMAAGARRLRGPLLLILSGNDLTAKEFLQYVDSSAPWRELMADAKVSRADLPDADHTFSRRAWLEAAHAETIRWLDALSRPAGGALPSLSNNAS